MLECQSKCPSLRYLILIDGISNSFRREVEIRGLKIFSMEEMLSDSEGLYKNTPDSKKLLIVSF